MANFSNITSPKAGALNNKLNSSGPHIVPPVSNQPKNIFNQGGIGGAVANIGADIGGGIKNAYNTVTNKAAGALPALAKATASPLAMSTVGPLPQAISLLSKFGASVNQPQQSHVANAQTVPETPPAIKSQSTDADGSTKTEYHPPATPPAPVAPTPPSAPIQPAPQSGSTMAPKNPILAAAIDQSLRAPTLRQNLTNTELATSRKGIALPFVAGQQGALEQAYGAELTGEAQKAQALGNLAGYGQPQPYSLLSQPYNPLTDTYGGGGTGGAINRAVNASNIGSAQDFQGKIQTTQAAKDAADANFSILNDYAAQGGAASDSPIISGLLQKFGQTVGGQDSAPVAGFKAQLQSVRSAYQALTGGDPMVAIPDAITPNQLKQVQQSLKDTVQNNLTSYQNQLGNLRSGNGSSAPAADGNTSASTTTGSWPGWNPQ